MSAQSVSSPWQKALSSLDNETKTVLTTLHQNSTRKKIDTLATIAKIAEDQRQECIRKRLKIHKLNGQVIVLRDVMEKVIRWVNKFKEVGDIAVQYDPSPAALAWSGVRFILQSAVNNIETFNAVAEGLEAVSRLIAARAASEVIFTTKPSTISQQYEEALTSLYIEILLFEAKAIKYYKTPKARRILLSPFQVSEKFTVSGVLTKEEQVSRLTNVIIAEVVQDNRGKLDGTMDLLRGLEANMIRLVDHTQRSESRIHDDLHRDLVRWLSSVQHQRHHKLYAETRLQGSGEWLLHHQDYLKWRSSSSSAILLLQGIPGSGKTTLASAVVDSFLTASTPPTGLKQAPLSYFYCSNVASEPDRSDSTNILRSIVRQIAISSTSQQGQIHPALTSLLAEYKARLADATGDSSDLERLNGRDCVKLIRIIADIEPLTIIIDALDEVREDCRSDLISALDEIVKDSQDIVKVFLTSRHSADISLLLPNAIVVNIEIDIVSNDMGRFVRWQVDKAIKDRRLLRGQCTSQFRDSLTDSLVRCAGEMFLWVTMQIERLCQLKTEDDILAVLPSLPPKLEQVYSEIWSQILDSGKASAQLATRILCWLLHARKPLSPEILISAIRPTRSRQNTSLSFTFLEIADFCSHLIILDTGANIVRLSHASIQEFLLTRPEFAEADAHRNLTHDCLLACSQLLPLSAITPGFESPFATEYAVAYWPEHYSRAGHHRRGVLCQQMLDFLLDEDNEVSVTFRIWITRVSSLVRRLPTTDPMTKRIAALGSASDTPLFTAAEFGLLEVLEKLAYSPNTNWDSKNELGCTALYLASVSGHADVARFLIGQGADLDAEGGNLGTPAHAAAYYGHSLVAQLLLDSDADGRKGHLANMVQAALRGGHEDIALLAISSITPALSNDELDTVMEEACAGGFLRVIKSLQSNPLYNKRSGHQNANNPSQKALNKAIENGSMGAIQLLLEGATKPADVLPSSAIALAATHGQTQVIQFCVDKGLDINQPGPLGSPIRAASLLGHESTVRTLIDLGAQIRDYQPLQAAAMKGHIEVVKTLIYIGGVKPDEDGDRYETPLAAAAFHGHVDIVRLLLAEGGDPKRTSRSSGSRNAFHAAIEGGRNDILQIFHEAGYTYQLPQDLNTWEAAMSRGGGPSLLVNTVHGKIDMILAISPKPANKQEPENLSAKDTAVPSPALDVFVDTVYGQGGPGGYVDVVKDLILQRRISGHGTKELMGLLVAAIEQGNPDIVHMIISEIGDLFLESSLALKEDRKHWLYWMQQVDKSKAQDWTPLGAAANRGHSAVVDLFLGLRENSEQLSIEDIRELLSSSSSGNVQLFDKALGLLKKWYLDTGDISETLSLLQNALRTAAEHNQPDIVAMILSTDPSPLSDLLQTGFQEDTHKGLSEPHKMTSAGLSVSADLDNFRQYAMTAVRDGYCEVRKLLMSKDPRVANTALLLTALRDGSSAVVSLLVDRLEEVRTAGGITTTDREILGQCLVLAAYHGRRETVEVLLAKGSDVNTVVSLEPKGDVTPLRACLLGCISSVDPDSYPERVDDVIFRLFSREVDTIHRQEATLKLLLASGADVNILEPLLLAVKYLDYDSEVTQLMIQRGADTNGLDCNTPWSSKTLPDWIMFQKFRLAGVAPNLEGVLGLIADLTAPPLKLAININPFIEECSPEEQLRLKDTVSQIMRSDHLNILLGYLALMPVGDTDSVLPLCSGLLFFAALAGDVTWVEALVKVAHAASPDSVHWLCKYGVWLLRLSEMEPTDFFRDLMRECVGCSFIAQNECLRDAELVNALHAALLGGHRAVVEIFITSWPELKDELMDIPPHVLRLIVSAGHVPIVEYLLATGVDFKVMVSPLDEFPKAPLLVSAVYGENNTPMVELLLGQGFDPTWKDGDLDHSDFYANTTPLDIAAENGDIDSLCLLLEKAAKDNHLTSKRLFKGLKIGVLSLYPHIVKEYLSWGASPFHLAKGRRRNLLVDLLKTKTNPYSDMSNEEWYARAIPIAKMLISAFQEEMEIDTKKDFLDAGDKAAQINALDIFELVADHLPATDMILRAASQLGSWSTVERMLREGVDVNAQPRAGFRALHVAASNLQWRVVQVLLDAGADITHRNPVQAALKGYLGRVLVDKDAIRLIYERYRLRQDEADQPWELRRQIESSHGTKSSIYALSCLQTVRILLQHGAEASSEEPDHIFGTALHMACFLRNEPLVEVLLRHGADVNATGGVFETPLYAAMYGGDGGSNRRVIKMLLERGADVNYISHKRFVSRRLEPLSHQGPVMTLGEYRRHLNLERSHLDNAPPLGTPLRYACLVSKAVSSIELLLAYGAGPDGNQDGGQLDALLLEALADGQPIVIWALLKYGSHRVRVKQAHLEAARLDSQRRVYQGKTNLERLVEHHELNPGL